MGGNTGVGLRGGRRGDGVVNLKKRFYLHLCYGWAFLSLFTCVNLYILVVLFILSCMVLFWGVTGGGILYIRH